MKTCNPRQWACVVALAAAGVIFGDVSTADAAKKKKDDGAQPPAAPVFFPAAPEAPRLQFLTTFSDASALGAARKKKKSSFADWITGAKDEKKSSSKFDSPYGIAVRDGKAYVCDVGTNKVHVLDWRNKAYSTLDGHLLNPVNIAIDTDGTKYVCDTERLVVLVYGADDRFQREIKGPPTSWSPIDVVIHGKQLLVADVTGGTIHVLDKDGTLLRKIGKKGTGPDELASPTNLDIGPDGRIYVTDTVEQEIKVFDMEGKYVGAVGGPGSVVGRFARPKGIAIDAEGQIYVADTQWDVIQIFRPDSNVLLAFGKPGPEPHAMGMPAGLAIDKTSIEDFRPYLAPNFEPQYLLFVVNQFGKNKVTVFAYGRDRTLSADKYEIDMKKVEAAKAKMKAAAEAEAAKEKAKMTGGTP